MEITLEKIELVKDRTGVTYANAKKALEDADGSVVDAIIAIEETINSGEKQRGFGERGEALFNRLKDLVKKGNVAKIQVRRDEEQIINIPVNVGIVGICIAPLASVVAIVAAFGFKCTIEVVKDDGTIVDISDAVTDKVTTVAEKGSNKAEFLKNKGKEYYGKIKEKAEEGELVDAAKEKASEVASGVAEKGKEYYDKAREKADENELVGKAKEKVSEAADKGREYYDKAMESELVGKAKEKATEAKEKAGEVRDKATEVASGVADKIKKDPEEFDMSDLENDEADDVQVEVEIEQDKE